MAVKTMTMDGNKAAAYVAYAYTEIAAIYPITPSTPMAEQLDTWSAQDQRNIFGDTVRVIEMESEAGAAGTMHGSLQAGALTSTFTASQGLLLMIPNMYKMAGELLPGVFHVSARTIATHALSIYGDHSDVMACRQTGFAMLASSNVQEAHDYAIVAHLSAIKSRVPFLHFFDGFRTSHEMQKIQCLDYPTLKGLLDMKAVEDFRSRALSPNHPVTRGSAQTPDIFFQNREASNKYYQNLPTVVENIMEAVSKATGRKLSLVEYKGAADAEKVIIVMGSMSDVAASTVEYLAKKGQKVGVAVVHMYRPFPIKALRAALPKSARKIAVLDRTKESGSAGEPLYLDVCAAFNGVKDAPLIVGGRYGLSSKNTSPAQVAAVFENLDQKEPKNSFTVGIVDDVTFTSLPLKEDLDIVPADIRECKFYGIGADGTVGANKSSIAIIGDNTDLNVQAHFEYDSKKSGGYTVSHLRFGKSPIRLPYIVENPHFVNCSLNSYVYKYDMLKGLRKGGTFLLNTPWTPEEVENRLPDHMKRYIADNEIKFYIINATGIARDMGLGSRSNTILQAAFFKLADIIPYEEAVSYMKASVKKTYGRKGDEIVKLNCDAIDKGADELIKIDPKPEWKKCSPDFKTAADNPNLPDFIKNIANPVSALKGDDLPVSVFTSYVDGTMMSGSTKFEKRYTSDIVPEWIADNCIQCNQCAFVCPHAVIRPFLIDASEEKAMPKMLVLPAARQDALKYRIAISVADCTGCTACVEVCPGKGGKRALEMKLVEGQESEQVNFDWLDHNIKQKNPYGTGNAVGVQFERPYFEYHSACPGCGETPYIKLVTQLFGNRMMIANTTGCSSIYGASYPSAPYSTDSDGFGPAWANSLFEDNAEFGLGIHAARQKLRDRALRMIGQGLKEGVFSNKTVFEAFLKDCDSNEKTREVSAAVQAALKNEKGELASQIAALSDFLVKPSMWMFGGDGWAYDIGYQGVDHVLSMHENINMLVLDTEVYSNTGGQASKSTSIGAQAQFARSGKASRKKNLGLMIATYGHVYVAQIAMGANKAHTLKVIQEAESYDGPSLIIAYAPCIAHGLKKGLKDAQVEEKFAVDCGYWHLWRWDPRLEAQGKNPFQMDSKEPDFSKYQEFIAGEVRFSALNKEFPARAKELFADAEVQAKTVYNHYKRLAAMNYSE